jgi:hypothetical protein|tara:strand:- start:3685 stop:4116 length:432 start_codon:yes stop_codon:yes gene_type:complete
MLAVPSESVNAVYVTTVPAAPFAAKFAAHVIVISALAANVAPAVTTSLSTAPPAFDADTAAVIVFVPLWSALHVGSVPAAPHVATLEMNVIFLPLINDPVALGVNLNTTFPVDSAVVVAERTADPHVRAVVIVVYPGWSTRYE